MSARRRWTKCWASSSRPAVGVEVDRGELRVEQAEQVAERLLLAAVRGGGDQEEVAVGVGGQARAAARSAAGSVRCAVRRRPATQVWASSTITRSGQCAEEVVAVAGRT